MDRIRWLSRLLRAVSRTHAPEVFVVLVCAIAAGWGISLLTIPERFPSSSLDITFQWASPRAWGVSMVAAAAMFILVVLVDRSAAMWPAVAMVLLFSAWGLLTWLSVPSGGAPPLLSTGLAWLCSALGLIYFNDAHPAARATR